MVSRSSAAAHVRLNQACRRPTVYPHFFAHNLGYPLIHCFSNADGQRPTDSLNVLREDTHPHNVSRQWKQKDSHLKATKSHYMWQICHLQKNQNRYMWQTRPVSSLKRPQSVPPRRDFPWKTATYNGNHFSEMPKTATYRTFQTENTA